MAAGDVRDRSVGSGEDWILLPAGTYNLGDGSCGAGVPKRMPRLVIADAAGDWSMCKNANGVDRPLPGRYQSYAHTAFVSEITATAAIVVVW